MEALAFAAGAALILTSGLSFWFGYQAVRKPAPGLFAYQGVQASLVVFCLGAAVFGIALLVASLIPDAPASN